MLTEAIDICINQFTEPVQVDDHAMLTKINFKYEIFILLLRDTIKPSAANKT